MGSDCDVSTLEEIAERVRSKNAGPFWLTLDVFFKSVDDFDRVVRSNAISKRVVADLYQVDPSLVRIFHLPAIPAVKVSFPRSVIAGSFEDRDLHAGQQHVLLAGLVVPSQ